MRIYDHVMRVFGLTCGDLRMTDTGVFGSVQPVFQSFMRPACDLAISNVWLQPGGGVTPTTYSNFVVTLWLDPLSAPAGPNPMTLTSVEMERLCVEQLRVFVHGTPVRTTFICPASEQLVVVPGEQSVTCDGRVMPDVVVRMQQELCEHLNGFVRDADGVFRPGNPCMNRIIKLACNADNDTTLPSEYDVATAFSADLNELKPR